MPQCRIGADVRQLLFDAAVANAGIIADAVPYSGDTARAAAQKLDVVQPAGTRLRATRTSSSNSGSRYWQESDGTDPNIRAARIRRTATAGSTAAPGRRRSGELPPGTRNRRSGAPPLPLVPRSPEPKEHRPSRYPRGEVEKNGFLPLRSPRSIRRSSTPFSPTRRRHASPDRTQQLFEVSTSNAWLSGPGWRLTFPYACWITSQAQGAVTIHPNNSSRATGPES